MLEPAYSGMSQPDGSAVAHPSQPPRVNKSRKQRSTDGTSDVVLAFCPIQTLIGMNALALRSPRTPFLDNFRVADELDTICEQAEFGGYRTADAGKTAPRDGRGVLC
jgi:hypothetical protein